MNTDSTSAVTGTTTEEPALKGTRAHLLWIWRYWAGHKSILITLALLTLVSTSVAVA